MWLWRAWQYGAVGKGQKAQGIFVLDIVHGGDGSLGISFLHVSHKTEATAAAGISILDDHLDTRRLEHAFTGRAATHSGSALIRMLGSII